MVRKYRVELVLLLTWSLLIFLATMGQIRFAEYLTIPVGLLSGYFCWQVISRIPVFLRWLEFKAHAEMVTARSKSSRKKSENPARAQKKGYAFRYNAAYASLGIGIVLLAVLLPDFSPAQQVSEANSGITGDWHDALVWMRDNTPEPFQNPDFFNAVYQKPAAGQSYPYPATAYGVMAWWTRGHLITQLAHRIPNSNPHQSGASTAAKFFIEENVESASQILQQSGSRYIMVDFDMAMPFDSHYVTMGFPPMVTWAGKDLSQYCDIYYQEINGVYKPITIYYPAYYRTMTIRLFCFGGEAVVPANSTQVISYTVRSGHRIIQSIQTFPTYEDALAFLSRQNSSSYLIAGTSPFLSPVPLEKLSGYEQVYQSATIVARSGDGKAFPSLRIIKYSPGS
jgi:dolichyl-diphosphooligosaccharide--protein glycosyltransferase